MDVSSFVSRAMAQCVSTEQLKAMQVALHPLVAEAVAVGDLATRDWAKMPLPPVEPAAPALPPVEVVPKPPEDKLEALVNIAAPPTYPPGYPPGSVYPPEFPPSLLPGDALPPVGRGRSNLPAWITAAGGEPPAPLPPQQRLPQSLQLTPPLRLTPSGPAEIKLINPETLEATTSKSIPLICR